MGLGLIHYSLVGLGALALLGGGAVALTLTRIRTTPNAAGVISDDPVQLARAAGVPPETYALARMVASEHPRDSETVQVAICWATRNYAARARLSVWDLLVTRGDADSANHFARQNAGGKYASTVNDPTQAHVNVAHKVMLAQVPDPTNGATQYDSPKAQRAAAARSVTGYTKSPEQVAADRIRSGSELVVLAGVDPDDLRFWRPAQGVA